jgi:alkanesulfonate monooxygenase SsuD/methylene tetrahydromethanopterin reductase-like flavin-dependent oxidoreductase (luciferase family)
MVAKMAETLDRLSGGRLILGLGAGYSDEEFAAFGLTVPSPREKVEGLEEALRIIRGLWSEPGFTFAGRRYHVADADIEPKPARPIPIWLGTFGDRALAVTGRHADGWIPSLGYAPVERLPSMRDRVLAAAEAAGRSPDDLTCALNVEVHIGDDADARPGLVGGAPDQVAARLQDFVALGFTAFNFMVVGEAASEQAERLVTEIISELRAAG